MVIMIDSQLALSYYTLIRLFSDPFIPSAIQLSLWDEYLVALAVLILLNH